MTPPHPPKTHYRNTQKNPKPTMREAHMYELMEKEANKMPNWYGIETIKYEWRGPWEGPTLHYKGHTFDKNDIEDGLWQMFLDDNQNTNDWEHYVNDNATEYLEDIIFATENEN